MSNAYSQTKKSTKTSNTTTSATQSISDAYNQTLSVVNNNSYGAAGASGEAGGISTKMLAIGGLAIAGLIVLALSFK